MPIQGVYWELGVLIEKGEEKNITTHYISPRDTSTCE